MKHITLLVGPPGAGKSTLAQSLIYDDGDHGLATVYISQDEQGKVGHLELFEKALSEGKDIIVDRLNFVKVQRDRYLNPAKDLGYSTKIVVLHENYKVCLERCLARTGHATIKDEKDARSALQMFFNKYERVEDNEAHVVVRHWQEKISKRPAIWIDIDGTLANNDHREHFVRGEKKDWKNFFKSMNKDSVNLWCKTLVNGMYRSEEVEVLIVSARPDNYRDVTKIWLHENGVNYDELIMRNRGDFRKDAIVKLQLFEFEIKTRYNLMFSVDDRKQVVDFMRQHGIIVLDCKGEKGNF